METIYLKIGLAIIFTLAVIGKLTGKTKSTFEKSGYSLKVMYAIAISEIIFTVMLFTKFELYATLGLLAIMGGAFFTLLRQKEEPKKYSMAIITTVLLSLLVYFSIR